MSMTRKQLASVIDFGRNSTLNCVKMVKDIHRESETLSKEGEKNFLFNTPILNKTVLLKTIEVDYVDEERVFRVETLVYFPYDVDNVYEGGDSVSLSDPAIKEKILLKMGTKRSDETANAAFEKDQKILKLVKNIPSFDPFMLKSKAEQWDMESEINDIYFNISEEEWEVLQERIRSKIRRLVRKAVAQEEVSSNLIEKQVNIFLNKIWEAKDLNGIEELVSSLGVDEKCAPNLFFSWKAICYYQSMYHSSKNNLMKLFQWIGNEKTCLPRDYRSLPKDVQDILFSQILDIRRILRNNHAGIVDVLSSYERGYENFINQGDPIEFTKFLGKADIFANQLASALASYTHAINLLSSNVDRWGPQLKGIQHLELINALCNIYGVKQKSIV